ncbi:MAG: pyruvate dehydrogenase complex dihydrolipoamide acetyltransferase [Stellaceae bacterium]
MSTNILMPALSPTMTEGTLARWLKKEGEPVKAGDVLAEIETDKATMEVEAVDEGVIGKIIVPDGTAGVKVNAPIAVLLADGETMADAPPATPEAAAPAPPPAQPAPPKAPPKPAAPSPATPAPATPAPRVTDAVAASAHPAANGHRGGRIFVSPLARRMAGQAGLDLSGITGTGPQGRIVKADVEAALTRAPVAPEAPAAPDAPVSPAAPAAPPPEITAPHRLVPHTTMRRVIARRLSESKRSIPHFYLSMDLAVDALLELRADLNGRAAKQGPGAFRLSVNDLIIKAAAAALTRVPRVNASWSEAGIIEYEDIDISVAVAIPEGLITPIVRHADHKGLAAISNEMKDLVGRAKAGKLKLEEFEGGGFTISNLGMYGIREFAAVINPPQAAILAVGCSEQRPVVKDGAVSVATMMTCTLAVDHRVIDGVLGSAWLAAFKAIIEDPLSLML